MQARTHVTHTHTHTLAYKLHTHTRTNAHTHTHLGTSHTRVCRAQAVHPAAINNAWQLRRAAGRTRGHPCLRWTDDYVASVA